MANALDALSGELYRKKVGVDLIRSPDSENVICLSELKVAYQYLSVTPDTSA